MSTIPKLITCVLCAALFCGPALSQTTFATITGTVTDTSGAIVQGVAVVAINSETNIRTEAKSNSAGVYTLSQLKEGNYTVRARSAGFKEFVAQNVILVARDDRRVDVQLAVGDVGTTVEVTAGATLIETETARINDTKSSQELKSLPVNSRAMWQFMVLTPGVIGTSDGYTRFAGSAANQSTWAVDGTTMADGVDGSAVGPLANYVESFQELKIDMANNSAEFGPVGQVTIVSKSGTNRLRGSIFDYYTTPWFRARNTFALARTTGVLHMPGASVGGPVYIPKIYDGRNKTFFFASWEISTGSAKSQSLNPSVPLETWRGGNFADQTAAIYDPLSNTPFAGNQLPASRINPVSKKIQERFYPLPNYGVTTAFSAQNYREEKSRNFDPNTYLTTRVDHRISDSDSIFGRITDYRSENGPFEGNLPTIGQRIQNRKARSATISETHIFSPTVINEARWGYVLNNNPLAGPINGPEIIKELGVTGLAPDLPDISGLLRVTWSGLALAPITQINYANPGYRNHGEDFQDHISWLKGKHTVKFGVNLSRVEWDDLAANNNTFGTVQFSKRFSSKDQLSKVGGFPYADFLLGIPTTASRAFAPIRADRNRWQYDFFFNDDFKVNSKLTMNLGVRYEYHTPWRESSSRIATFDIATSSIVVPDGMVSQISPAFPTDFLPVIEASKAGFRNGTLVNPDRNNFAPRIGLAYRPWGANTVIRAGYGIYYNVAPWDLGMSGIPYVLSEPAYTNPIGSPDVIFPRVFPAATNGAGSAGVPAAVNPDLRIPYSMQYNFTLEHQMLGTGFRASYIGTASRKVEYGYNINQPIPDTRAYVDKPRLFPQYEDFNYITNGAGHQYNSLTLEAQRRMTKGLYFQTSWVWARDIVDLERGQTPENAYDRQREVSVAQGTPTHRINLNYVYELPFGKGRPFNVNSRVLNFIAGGWDLSGVFSLFSGQFLTPAWSAPDTTGTAYSATKTPAVVQRRPNVSSDPNLPSSERTIARWFDTSVFSAPLAGQYGNAAGGIIKGPGVNVWHMGLAKQVYATERVRLRAEITASNIFNHPNWSNPGTVITGVANAGRISATGGVNNGSQGDMTAARGFRSSLRLEF